MKLKKLIGVCLCLILLSSNMSTIVIAQYPDPVTGNIDVLASIPPQNSDISLSIHDDSTGPLSENNIVTITIEYEAQYAGSYPLTIESNWYLGTIDGQASPSVDGLQYVVGSASSAYNSTSPIIDIAAKKITWSIPSFPASAGRQVLSYQLIALPPYIGSSIINFPVNVGVTNPVVTTEQETLIQFKTKILPTPTPTSSIIPTGVVPTSTPGSSAVTQVTSPATYTVAIREVSAYNVSILLKSDQDLSAAIMYGSSPHLLDKKIVKESKQRSHLFSLTGLKPNQKYYFTIVDSLSSKKVSSNIFTFTTSTIPFEDKMFRVMSANISQKGNVLYYGKVAIDPVEIPDIFMLSDTVVDIHLQTDMVNEISFVESAIRVDNVLGISTDYIESQVYNTASNMDRVGDELFVSKLRTPENSGKYQLVAVVHFNSGTIKEYIVGTLTTVKPLRVIDQETQKPIEHVTAYFYRFNQNTQLYEKMPTLYGLVANPAVSDFDGSIYTTLLPGMYKVIFSHNGYSTVESEFTIDPDAPQQLPTIVLVPTQLHIVRSITNGWPVIARAFNQLHVYAVHVTESSSLIYVIAILNCILTIGVVGLLAHAIRTKSHIVYRFLQHHKVRMKVSFISVCVYVCLYSVLSIIHAYAVVSVIICNYFVIYNTSQYALIGLAASVVIIITVMATEIYTSIYCPVE